MTEPVGAKVLVVEGWIPDDEIGQAVDVWRDGKYERVVTTGAPIRGPIERFLRTTYAELTATQLAELGVPREVITPVPAPESAQDRSFLSAVMVREWAKREGLALDRIDVMSPDAHARRSRMNYRLAFGDGVDVGIIAAKAKEFDGDTWWTTSGGAKRTIGEALSFVWTWLFFHPPPPGSHEERWATPPRGK